MMLFVSYLDDPRAAVLCPGKVVLGTKAVADAIMRAKTVEDIISSSPQI